MATMRVAQVSRPGGPLELVERPIPDPGPGSVRIKVQACGVCHSDVFTREGQWPGITFPRVPGHEVVGVIDAVGKDVPARWQAGQRVGVGWHAWHCLSCDNCRRGDFFACQTGAQVTGISFDGGYADYLVTPATALARVPAELPAPDAAPLMCAGVTTFNALRNSGARSVEGWYTGTSIDSEDTLAFSVQSGVRSMNEVYPLERAAEAYDRMMSGKARFRVVLTIGN